MFVQLYKAIKANLLEVMSLNELYFDPLYFKTNKTRELLFFFFRGRNRFEGEISSRSCHNRQAMRNVHSFCLLASLALNISSASCYTMYDLLGQLLHKKERKRDGKCEWKHAIL